MKIKAALSFSFCCVAFLPAFPQTQMFNEAFHEFSTSRLWDFEEIPIDWQMEGMLQADLNEGLNGLLEEDPAKAEASLTIVIEKDSTVWQAYYYRAAARKQLEKLGMAETDMQRALNLRGDFYEGLVELSKILHLRRETYESERAINKAIRLDRSRGAGYYLKGDVNMSQNELRHAMNNYKDCLAADSLFHNARIKLALLHAVLKNNMDDALGHLNRVLSYDSLQKSALLFRSILGREKDKKQAVKDLSNLIRVSPNHLMALYYRGIALAELGDYEGAFVDFHKVIKSTSTSDNNYQGRQTWLDKKIDLQNAGAYAVTRLYGLPEADGLKIRQGYCHILTGDYDKCITVLSNVTNASKEPVAAYLKAVAFEHKGDHLSALRHYDSALALDNALADAYKKRGIYEHELKQWDKAVQDFTEVLKIYPDGFFINRLRGVSYYRMGRFHDALADFEIYLKNDSTNKQVRGFRGMTHMKLNQRLIGYTDLAASDNLEMLNFRDMELLVESLLQAGDTTQALHSLNVILDAAPYFTEGYVQKLQIHMARSEWPNVSNHITRAMTSIRVDAAKSKRSYLLTVQALVYSRNRHTDDAVKTFSEAIRFDKKNGLAYLERGRLFLAMGKSSKAEDDFRKALALGNLQAKEIMRAMVEE